MKAPKQYPYFRVSVRDSTTKYLTTAYEHLKKLRIPCAIISTPCGINEDGTPGWEYSLWRIGTESTGDSTVGNLEWLDPQYAKIRQQCWDFGRMWEAAHYTPV